MYKFIITIELQPGSAETVLARAHEALAATRAEEGNISYDFFQSIDNPDKIVFVETWKDEAAHAFHMEQAYTKEWIAFHEQYDRKLTFETVNPAA